MRLLRLALCALVLTACLSAPLAAQPMVSSLLVVPNRLSQDVSLIDAQSLSELARIPLAVPPAHVAVSANRQFAYVASERIALSGASHLFKIDLVTRAIVAARTIATDSQFVRLALSPDGQTLIAIDRQRATVYRFDTGNLTLSFTRVLCASCDGVTQALYSAPSVVFTPDSQLLHAAIPVAGTLMTLNVGTGQTVSQHPLNPSGSSTAYSAIQLFDIAPSIPIITHPFTGLKAVETGSGWQLPLTFFPASLAAGETVAFRLGSELFLVQGEITYDAAPDLLRLYHVNSGGVLSYSSSEATFSPLVNASTLEVWSVCRTLPAAQACDPFRIDAINLVQPGLSQTIIGPGVATQGTPRFSLDYQRYLFPLANSSQVFVVDTGSKQPLAPIAVGQGPFGVY